ncbi:Rho termination factor N-terminal domain-containing protein [Pseudomonas sp. SAICEU22]|jgi:plasmid stabilization system protein ParE|uniref:Rho termination factor N-terminal domain-containing protein n=2 Tax=Pseudomonas TaxID=286 RepID=A0ABT3FC80_9PSED|nr:MULTISPECIES: Rho termination factor N-terminal domain-containing protein [Pseudomonas]MBJ2349522.1 Rho termination factor N-terminal domain-containing protein [Pseudomonas canavaninivorans]MBL3545361.1 Rho termination factor N-terminal domain-containing protein [Pseudomonas sp. HB05]MCL6703087.1 Rho termination factor N-terminal domain-containing protein [Pseudomonas sp. T1.Ur]MCW1246314.1 Rho termination factor N-terminal domain-containing protein [Pseudomonas agronomica]QXI55080.1 Rho te
MPRGSKDKYTDKQKRKAEHIEESYEHKGVSEGEAEARAWATVNKQSGGGERSGGSGKKKPAEAKQSDRKESARRAAKSREGHPRTSKASHEAQTVDSLMKEARAKNIPGRSKMRKQELVEALRKAG